MHPFQEARRPQEIIPTDKPNPNLGMVVQSLYIAVRETSRQHKTCFGLNRGSMVSGFLPDLGQRLLLQW